MEWIEEDLKELAEVAPEATTIQLLSANPLCMTYDKLAPILEMINRYLPKIWAFHFYERQENLSVKYDYPTGHLQL